MSHEVLHLDSMIKIMKKRHFLPLILVLSFSSCMLFDSDVEDTGLTFSSAEEIYSYVLDTFTYKSDFVVHNRDYWQSPKETLDRKTGDCEDFATFILYELDKIGIEGLLLACEMKNSLHAVVEISSGVCIDPTARIYYRKADLVIVEEMFLVECLRRAKISGSY